MTHKQAFSFFLICFWVSFGWLQIAPSKGSAISVVLTSIALLASFLCWALNGKK